MQLVIKWDRDSFKYIFDIHFNSLCAFAKRYLSDVSQAEDVVQESFIGLWEKREDFNHINAAKAFLYTSVRNKCLNILKHKTVIIKHEEELILQLESDQFFTEHIIEEETFNKLLFEINLLPQSCKEITMLALNGLKNSEIAEELNISINTVKTQKKIAFSKLRHKMSDTVSALFLVI